MRLQKIVIAPDSFKGTMTAAEVCETVRRAFSDVFPELSAACIPVADGGEGTTDAFLYAKSGEKRTVRVQNALGEETDAFYGVIDTDTAVIETAAASGLPQIEDRRDALSAHTFGTGQLIRHALEHGCRRIILGLGGSASTDLGTGALSALGVRFLRADGRPVPPGGGYLTEIAEIDASGLCPLLAACDLTIACDVDNPLYGEHGAARVFAPQKGAAEAQVRQLDEGLRHLAALVYRTRGIDLQTVPGAGAAGGLGAGLIAFTGARLKKGVDIVLDVCGFDEQIRDCQLVVTGEGRLDSQSLAGKVPVGVADRARAAGKPVVVIAGDVTDDGRLFDAGLTAVFSTNRKAVPFERARLTCRQDLYAAALNVARLLAAL